jgi:threonine dehydratase
LVRDGRRLRLRVKLPDHPGALERLAAVIAKQNANIVETHHDRAHYGVSLSETAIDITMETRGREHAEEVKAALTDNHFRFHIVE